MRQDVDGHNTRFGSVEYADASVLMHANAVGENLR
jgi:hypothetical protein